MSQINFKKNHIFFVLFAIFWLLIFLIEYFLRSGHPYFICNDSFQYLSIAKNIYQKNQLTNITQYALDLYYDELALFNYDFSAIKPYHFPSYSIFLSIFYYIYNNDNFVIYSSQYLSFLIFSYFSFLIFRYYLDIKKSLILVFLVIFSTTIFTYISDSGKEIICSGLSIMAIYLSLYSPKKNLPYIKIILCLTLIFLVITRYFYLVLGFLIVFYNWLPANLKDDENSLSFRAKIADLLLLFLIPLSFYIFFYYFQNFHLFIFDNRTDIYGGKTISDFVFRFVSNSVVAFFMYFIMFFQIIQDGFVIKNFTLLFSLFQIYGISVIGMITYFIHRLKNFKNHKKITKLLIVTLFFSAILFAVIIRFGLMGYRLIMAYIVFSVLIIYQSFFDKKTLRFANNEFLKYFFVILLISNLLINIVILKGYSSINKDNYNKNNYALDYVQKFKPKFILAESSFFMPHSMPFFHLYPSETYFYNNWGFENMCADLENYHYHKINFDMIFTKKLFNENNCEFANKNFKLIDFSQYGYIYYANRKIIK